MTGTERKDLYLILAAALLLRLLVVLLWAPVVEADGAEYSRIAENLLAGRGYVGLVPGPELMLPPLYAVAMAVVVAATGVAAPVAGRIVSLVAGMVLVLVLHRLASRLWGRRTARVVGALAAGLPLLVLASTAVFAESLQACLLAGGIWFAVRTAQERRVSSAICGGILFGLAYLARVETLGLALLAFALLLTGFPRRDAPDRRPALPALAFLLCTLVAMLPYPWYLYRVTGEVRLEGKSERVAATLPRYGQDLSYGEANYAIDRQGEELGPWLSPSEILEGPGLVGTLIEQPEPVLEHTAENLLQLGWMYVSGHTILSIVFLVLFPFAWADGWRDRGTRWLDVLLLGLLLYFSLLGATYKLVLRYFAPVALVSVIWGGRGLVGLLRRVEPRLPPRLAAAAPALGVALLLLSVSRGAVTGFREYDESRASHRPVRELGQVLARDHEGGAVMGDDSRVAYYAGRSWIPLPAAPSWEVVRKRAERLGVRYLNVRLPREGRRLERPGAWFSFDEPPEGLVPVGAQGGHAVFRLRSE